MLRKVYAENGMVNDGWVSVDPADTELIEAVYKKTIHEGEERLMLAVLENAVEYFQKYGLARKPSGKNLFQEAEEWFLDKDGEALYSFQNICETLGLHPEHIRKGLLVWKGAKLQAEFRWTMPPLQPELTIIALSLWLIVFLGLTCVVFAFISMWKENRFGWPLRDIIWFTPTVAASCAVTALLAGYVQKTKSLEKVSHRG